MARPLLLMMWLTAWTMTPCGSLPNDENLIRIRCGVSPEVWPAVRGVLMRGWWLADDGRLYHDGLVEKVRAMLDKRANDAERTRRSRANKSAAAQADSATAVPPGGPSTALPPIPPDDPPPSKNPDVTRDTQVRPVSVTGEFDTRTRTRTRRDTEEAIASPVSPPDTNEAIASSVSPPVASTPKRKRAKPGDGAFLGHEFLVSAGVDPQIARDWLAVRKEKRLSLTQTAWDDVVAEAQKAGMTPAEAVAHSAKRSRAGFRASWLASDASNGSGQGGGGHKGGSGRHSGFEDLDYRKGVNEDGSFE